MSSQEPDTAPPRTLADAVPPRRRAQAAAIVHVLLEDGPVRDPSGRATAQLAQRLNVSGHAHEAPRTHFAGTLRFLIDAGIVRAERNGKRTSVLELAELPDDVPEVAPTQLHVVPALAPEPEDGAELEPGRPGRLAARLERTLPSLVAAEVGRALDERLSLVLGALGFVPRTEADDDEAEREQLASRVDALERELRTERADAHEARAELNRVQWEQLDQRTLDLSTVSVSVVPEQLRAVVREALADEWALHRTKGSGHLVLRKPGRTPVVFASTTGTQRAPRHVTMQLRASEREYRDKHQQ